MPEFYQTRMGQLFYEGTLPRIAKALERIATAAEAPKVTEPVSEPRKGAWTGKIMELSNAHITRETAEVLDEMVAHKESIRLLSASGEEHYAAIYPRDEFGWFVSVPEDPLADVLAKYADNTPWKSIVRCLQYAQSKGCQWLLLDRDADRTEDLPTYEW